MEVLEDAGAAIDLLNMEPLEEEDREYESTLEESSIVSAIINSVLSNVTPTTTNLTTTPTTTTPTPTIVPVVPACSEAASFLMLNPEEPIIDLTSSHRTIILHELPDDSLNDTLEDLQIEANEMDKQLGMIGTDPKPISDRCGETFTKTTELDKHTKTKHNTPNFQTLEKYFCADCEIEYMQREEFKKHMRDQHSDKIESEEFEINYLKRWSSYKVHSPDWSAMPPSVEARREEAIRSKEAKEGAQRVAKKTAQEVAKKTKGVEKEQLALSLPSLPAPHPSPSPPPNPPMSGTLPAPT